MSGRHSLTKVMFLVVAAICPLAAQEPGAYTASQADRGEAVFRRVCAQCHVAGQFVAPAFRLAWTGRTAFELFEQLRTTMPDDNPGRLPRQDYADLVAYLFRLNGAPAGLRQLLPEADSLRQVRITFATPEGINR